RLHLHRALVDSERMAIPQDDNSEHSDSTLGVSNARQMSDHAVPGGTPGLEASGCGGAAGGKHRRVADRLEPLRMCALRPTTGGHRTGRGVEVNSNLPLALICAGFALLALAIAAYADCTRRAQGSR